MREQTKSDIREILRPIDSYMSRVDEAIREKIRTGVPLIDECSLHLFRRGGKKIRAALIILCSGLRNAVPEGIVDVAAAAEIVHAATLIHDDIIDQSYLRRGDVTVSQKWGYKAAVLVGDYMYTRALEIAVSDDRLDLFPVMAGATRDMVKGELYQIEYSNAQRISKEHYFNIIELKTARFMAACAKLGAMKSGMDPEEGEELFQFGLNLGFAFQIVDDTLDVLDSQEETGKDTGNDFLDGKITLPFLNMLEKVTEGERRRYLEYAVSPDEKKWEEVRKRIGETDSINYCLGLAEEYVGKALKSMDRFPASEYKNIIIALSRFLIDRKF